MARAREDVITVLQDLASKDRHYEWYVKTGGLGNIAQELFRYWIRDAYTPHKREFQSQLTQAEQDKLEVFTQFFEARLPGLPIRFEALMTDVHWRGIAEYAEVLLQQFAAEEGAGEV